MLGREQCNAFRDLERGGVSGAQKKVALTVVVVVVIAIVIVVAIVIAIVIVIAIAIDIYITIDIVLRRGGPRWSSDLGSRPPTPPAAAVAAPAAVV